MNKLKVTFSPFHSNSLVSREYADAAIRLYKFANSIGRSYKDKYLSDSSICEFEWDANKSISIIKHQLGEMRNIGEYFNRVGYKEGITYNIAASNSRGGHNIKKDISADNREIHRIAMQNLVDNGLSIRANTWSAQTALLNKDDNKFAVDNALKIIEEMNNTEKKSVKKSK